MLRRTERMAAMGKLAASIAHEINNPLESVTNLFYLLKQHPSLDNEARRFAAMADEELKRVAHITKQTLGFYRKSPHPVAVSVTDVLDAVLDAYGSRIVKNQITVHKRYDSAEKLMAFPDELRQIFANLIGNAIEAVGRGGQLKLHVFGSRNWANSSGGVRINICDSGAGIKAADRNKIFEPFFTTKAERGTGLGLWVTKGIVHKYDGSVRFRSGKQGGWSGTCFSVFFPSNSGKTQSAKTRSAA